MEESERPGGPATGRPRVGSSGPGCRRPATASGRGPCGLEVSGTTVARAAFAPQPAAAPPALGRAGGYKARPRPSAPPPGLHAVPRGRARVTTNGRSSRPLPTAANGLTCVRRTSAPCVT